MPIAPTLATSTPRRLLVLFGVAIVVVGLFRLLDRATWIYYYRVLDDQTIVVGVVATEGAWTRVTGVDESGESVAITVSSFDFRIGLGPSSAVPIEATVTLTAPISDRLVVDGSSGLAVQRTRCEPPSYFAAGCT